MLGNTARVDLLVIACVLYLGYGKCNAFTFSPTSKPALSFLRMSYLDSLSIPQEKVAPTVPETEEADEVEDEEEDQTMTVQEIVSALTSADEESSEEEQQPPVEEEKSPEISEADAKLAARVAKAEARQQAILEARRQPKSEAEEKVVADRYAAMDSWEERAFNILLDIGMVEKTPDPDDPDYDAEYDDDICE